MFTSYWKTAFRHLVRHKLFTVLNIAGLSTSLACCLLILLWVRQELSYDRFHKNADHIYRLTATAMDQSFPLTGAPLAAALRTQLPGVKNAARVKANYGASTIFTIGERRFEEKGAFFADPSLLQVFSFPLVSGDPATALVRPDGLLLTERMARKYFGSEAAIGKTIRMNNHSTFIVTGILKDIPANSHLRFDILLPMSFDARTDVDILENHWDNLNFYTYLLLDESKPVTPAALAAMGRQISVINHQGEPTFTADFQLQPLTRIHLYSKLLYDVEGQGDIAYVRIFSVIAFFILLVACVNFMSLATARSAHRAREVGLRKVIGARRIQLIGQFLGESVLICFLALVLGVVLVVLALPVFNQVLGATLVLSVTDGWLFPGLLLVFLLTSLLSGSYPAFFLSAFRPIKVLKSGVTRAGRGSRLFRNGLVVFQFVVSIVLIVGTAVVYSQLHFIQNRDLGYDKENLLYLPLKGDIGHRLDALTAGLAGSAHLADYSIVSELPVNQTMGTAGVQWKGKRPGTHPMFSVMGVDEHFLAIFKMRLAAGRGFSPAFATDSINYVVNEKTLQVLGWDVASADGKPLTVWGTRGMVVGVVKDFNFKPVQSAIDPLILRFNPGAGKEWLRGFVVVKTRPAGVAGAGGVAGAAGPGGVAAALADLKTIWARLNPSYDFEYGFVDQALVRLYASEQRMGLLFDVFSGLAIFICCLGLFGLAAFTAEQRTKEIGIRKTLGASVTRIITLLSTDFLKLVLIAILIASPIAWYCMHQWLQGFAYKIPVSGWFFVGAGLAALAIALITVSFQATKAAVANPVKSLKAE